MMQNVRSLLLRLFLEELVNGIHKCFLNLKHLRSLSSAVGSLDHLVQRLFDLGVKASVMKTSQMFMKLVKKFRFNNLAQEEGPFSVICNIGKTIRSERNYRCFSNKLHNEETFLQKIE